MKRRRSQAFPDVAVEEQVHFQSEEDEQTEEEEEARRLDKERDIWESVKEEHFEVVDQLPLTLHRQYTLMKELDQQTHGYLDDLAPILRRYAAYRRKIETGTLTEAEPTAPSTPVASSSTLGLKTPARSVQVSEITPRTLSPLASPLALPVERIKPPQTGKEMLSHVAWLAEELMSAAQEKVNLAQAAHDYISRQIQVLGQSIKEQEASIALGARPGTQLAPVLLPEVAPPSRWTRNVAGRLVLDDDEPEDGIEVPTTVGILVDEIEQPPIKRTRGRKGRRSTEKETDDYGENTLSLKITLPATRWCYCHKPSDGEMVACDNENCQNQWFHLACTGLPQLPDESDTWYCDDCDPGKNSKKLRKR
ncbi:hypothetical protein BDP27DRAFT_1323898 [Rhodocollybia butyracea]|uniref:Chromatin modification-related protein n=1 Tax=Rhodocollybia butyracea TaxID=206335 RepID=A0A9P5PQL0_9AGAR|nr:hypothetical protein BDP27DRAFT_1323898 [Rhodocollybia butyracea]